MPTQPAPDPATPDERTAMSNLVTHPELDRKVPPPGWQVRDQGFSNWLALLIVDGKTIAGTGCHYSWERAVEKAWQAHDRRAAAAPTAFVSVERQDDGLYHWAADDRNGDPLTEGVAATRKDVDRALAVKLPGYRIDIGYIDNGHGL